MPQYPAARNRAARAATRVAAWAVRSWLLRTSVPPFAAGLPVESGNPGYGEACYGQRRVNEIPSYPATVWALVDEAAERWADHVLLADDHGRSLTGRQFRDAALGVAADLATRGITTGTMVSWQLPTTLETMVVMVALLAARRGAEPAHPDPARA